MLPILKPEILLVSSKFDFSTDSISLRLKEAGCDYFRLNRDQLHELEVSFDPETCEMRFTGELFEVQVHPARLKSVYYRAPTFLREVFNQRVSVEDQLSRSQWAAFIRNLALYDKAFWVNDPVATYRAEMKPLQLVIAARLGFNIPRTIISNSSREEVFSAIPTSEVAAKTIDTGIVSTDEEDGFIYTSFHPKSELGHYANSALPFIVQEALVPKVDIRVTIIGRRLFAVSITAPDGIAGDWRLMKDKKVTYSEYELPTDIKTLCFFIMKELNLNIAGLDLIYAKEQYYFIEINPTGEWHWLNDHLNLQMDKVIAELLIERR